jgi:hypothetical protein
MTKVVSLICLMIVGGLALVAATPAISRLVSLLVPLVAVVGIVATVFLLAWSYTRKW